MLRNPDSVAADDRLRPRRVLFFGKTKARTRCTAALVHGLRSQGLEVRWLNCSFLKRYFGEFGMKRIVRAVRRRFAPDLCFVFYHDCPRPLMEEFSRELPTVVWMEEQCPVDASHVDYVRLARLLCLSTPDLVRNYRERGIERSTFMLSGFSPEYHTPATGVSGFDRDIAFIGAPGRMGDRPGFLAWLAEHYRVEIFGRVEPWLPYLHKHPRLAFAREVRAEDYGDVCARSKIVLGLNQDHSARYYFSNRLFLTLACRGFQLIHYVPGVEELFEDGVHLAWFRDLDECLVKIEHYLEQPEERARIARAGYELALRSHTYAHRVRDILSILAGDAPLRESWAPSAYADRSDAGRDEGRTEPDPDESLPLSGVSGPGDR